MSYTKAINHNVNESDEKDCDCDDIIEDISHSLVSILVDVQSTND